MGMGMGTNGSRKIHLNQYIHLGCFGKDDSHNINSKPSTNKEDREHDTNNP